MVQVNHQIRAIIAAKPIMRVMARRSCVVICAAPHCFVLVCWPKPECGRKGLENTEASLSSTIREAATSINASIADLSRRIDGIIMSRSDPR
jgi:hypothetical protein